MMLRIFLFLSLIFLPSFSVYADSVKVGVINLKPWGSVSKDRKLMGQHIDFFKELSKRSGISFDLKIMTLPRIKAQLKSGEIDMTVIFKRDEMAPYVNFIGLVMPYNYYLVGRQGVVFNEKTVREVHKIGFTEGEEDVARKCFSEQFNPDAKMFAAPNYGNLLKMLNGNRIEGATIPSKGLMAYLHEVHETEAYINKLFVLCENEAYLQISKKTKALGPEKTDQLRNALHTMQSDGTIKKIASKYAEVTG